MTPDNDHNVTHNPIVLSLWWQYLNYQFLQKGKMVKADGSNGITESILYCDNRLSKKPIERKFTDTRTTKKEINFFPGQHCILPCLDFEAENIEPIPLYKFNSANNEWVENALYFSTWRKWKMRSISNESFIPEDLKLIFVDEMNVIISDIDLGELENPNAMIAKCNQQMVERFNA